MRDNLNMLDSLLRRSYRRLGSRHARVLLLVQIPAVALIAFVVAAVLIAVLGAVSIYRMSTDILPQIDIPVVSVVWQYTGMPADEVETRIVLINERVLTAAVNDIQHVDSQSLFGVGVIRDFAFAMNVGVIVGTYSSIFVASPILIWLNEKFLESQRRPAAAGKQSRRKAGELQADEP